MIDAVECRWLANARRPLTWRQGDELKRLDPLLTPCFRPLRVTSFRAESRASMNPETSLSTRIARALWAQAPRLVASLIIAGGFVWLFGAAACRSFRRAARSKN